MTNNQINYWKLQEERRSNRVNELEIRTHNRNTEGEATRHNMRQEAIGFAQVAETRRHDIATEQYQLSNLDELNRHNSELEAQGMLDLSRKQYEAETKRQEYEEDARHNLIAESETQRHNEALEAETNRSNEAEEEIESRRADAALEQAQAASTNAFTNAVTGAGKVLKDLAPLFIKAATSSGLL